MNGYHSKNKINMANPFFIIDDIDDEDYQEEIKKELEEEQSTYCNWVRNKQVYSPAADVEVIKKVVPGIYKINNDMALIKQSMVSDNLYKLSDSEIDPILEEVTKFWNKVENFKKGNLIHKRGILLEGPPGTGKSSLITLIINDLIEKYKGVVLLVNNVSDFTKAYDFLKSTFRRIEPDTFVITIIEDIDKLASTVILPELLDFLDGKASIEHHLVIATSNDTSEMPDALLRVSRLDRRFYIGYPSEIARREYFVNKGIEDNLLDEYVKQSEELTISELKELYIGTYILGNPFDEVIDQILNPFEKKEYSTKKSTVKQISID